MGEATREWVGFTYRTRHYKLGRSKLTLASGWRGLSDADPRWWGDAEACGLNWAKQNNLTSDDGIENFLGVEMNMCMICLVVNSSIWICVWSVLSARNQSFIWVFDVEEFVSKTVVYIYDFWCGIVCYGNIFFLPYMFLFGNIFCYRIGYFWKTGTVVFYSFFFCCICFFGCTFSLPYIYGAGAGAGDKRWS